MQWDDELPSLFDGDDEARRSRTDDPVGTPIGDRHKENPDPPAFGDEVTIASDECLDWLVMMPVENNSTSDCYDGVAVYVREGDIANLEAMR